MFIDTHAHLFYPNFEEDLDEVISRAKENDIDYKAHFYPDVKHGFHNNSTPRYDKEAADLAWERTIAFFKEKLS